MIDNNDLRQGRGFFAVLIFFIISCFFGYRELTYLILGKDASATVTKVSVITTGRGTREHMYRQVAFSFVEPNGTQRTGEDNMSISWAPPSSGVVKVRYTPGTDGRARLAENVNWIGISMFAAAMGLLLFFGVRLWLEARAATSPRKKTKRRRYADD
jgi:hypothetical protein